VAAVVVAIIGGVVCAALAAALAFVLHLGMSRGEAAGQRVALLIVFWVVAFLAVGLPVILGAAQRGVPLERLLYYPLSRGGLYRISLGASAASGVHVFWYPVLLVLTYVAVVVDRLPAPAWVAVSVVFSVSLIVWCHAVLLLVQRLLRKRRLKELVVLIGLVLLVVASMVPALIESRRGDSDPVFVVIPEPFSSVVGRTASVLPPSIAAAGVMSSVAGDVVGTAASLGLLIAWIAAGMAAGRALLGRTLSGEEGGSPAQAGAAPSSRWSMILTMDGWIWVPPPSRAVAARDLLYLLRSTVGKFNIVIVPFFVVMMGLLVAPNMTGRVLGVDRPSLVFIGIMIYASMFSNNFFYNAYAWEGPGIRSYFVSPVTARQVVFGKNLGLWLYNVILVVECVVSYAVIFGLPRPSVAISGLLACAAALLVSTIAGNFISPVLPVARDISKIGSSPSQTGILVSFGILLANMIVIGGLVVIAALAAVPWLQPSLMLLLVLLMIVAYRISLAPAARLLESRRESLMEAVKNSA